MIKDFFNNLKSYSSNQPAGFKNILENLDDEHRSKENVELIWKAYCLAKESNIFVIFVFVPWFHASTSGFAHV